MKQEYKIIRNQTTGDETWLFPDTIDSINLAKHFLDMHYNPFYTISIVDELSGRCIDIVNLLKDIKNDITALFCSISTKEQSFIRRAEINSDNCRYLIYFDFNQNEIKAPSIYMWEDNCLKIVNSIDSNSKMPLENGIGTASNT